ncbi:hypothetical protein N7523_006774 [Penicillium sp. IBT 18751x]|nr:hypothetical protein N7523_006774 [Penicillium sp. IBT 18751x]
METRLRKRSRRELDLAENKQSNLTSATACSSSNIDSNKLQEFKDHPLRLGSAKKKNLPESPVAERTTLTTKGNKAIIPQENKTAASKSIIPESPTGATQGSIAMSVHSVFARELQHKLDAFEAKFRASMTAHQAMQESAQCVRDTVQEWVDAWTSGQ